jgi:mitochondrial fission protein ELM1
LLGRKAGDNTQVRALADALGWPCVHKKIHARPWEILVQASRRASLVGIDRAASTALEPPWPDLVISAGRRNEPVARWIRGQSGGRSKLVHIGRPWASLDTWDLIVTTPQYFLPEGGNVVCNRLPLFHLDPALLESAGAALRARLGDLPGPLFAVLVGGDSGRFVFTASKGARLGQRVNALAAKHGGSLLVTNSARTPQGAWRALLDQLSVPVFSWSWGQGEDNPYLGFLALADELVVTGESMSMLGEASALGKPLHIFDMGDDSAAWWRYPHNYRVKPLSHHLLMAVGPRRMRRDVGRIQRALVAEGRACWLGESSSAPASPALPDELAQTARRVRALLAQA